MSMGGGKSKSSSSQNQQSASWGDAASWSGSGSFVDPAQAAERSKLWQSGMDLMAQQGNWGQTAQGIANPLFGQGQAFMKSLEGLANPQAQIAAQDASLRSGMSDILRQAQFSNGDAAARGGAFGGSRQGLMDAAAAGEVAKAYQQGYGDIVGRANAQAGQAAMGGLQGAQQLFNLGMAPQQAAWAPFLQMSSLLGDPTILNRALSNSYDKSMSTSQGSSRSNSSENKFSLGFEFG